MKLGEIAKITIKRLFPCQCCKTNIDAHGVGILGDDTIICKNCVPIVEEHMQDLLEVYRVILNKEPNDESLQKIRTLSLNIKIGVGPVPTTPAEII